MTRLRALVSYWYGRTMDTAETQAQLAGADVLLDSGAFSAHTSGAQITVEEYAAWLRTWAGHATAAVSLDVIGDPVASMVNYRRLVDAGTGVPIVPVFHAGTAPRHLDAIVETGATYVAFGGLVEHARNRAAVMRWTAWNLRRCAQAGVAVHALGASGTLARELPFYSADSSTWTMAPRRGFLCAWNPRRRLVDQVMVRDPERVSAQAVKLRAAGYDVARVARPGFLNTANGDTFQADRAYVFQQGARAFLNMADDLSRRRVVAAPPSLAPHTDPGTKLYLVVANANDCRQLLAAYAAHTEGTSP